MLSFLVGSTTLSYNPTVYTSPVVMQEISVSTTTVKNDLVPFYAKYYNIDPEYFSSLVKCESHYRGDAVGDFGTSFGAAQIHNPTAKGISKENALNVFFALNYFAKGIKYHTDKWSCERIVARPVIDV